MDDTADLSPLTKGGYRGVLERRTPGDLGLEFTPPFVRGGVFRRPGSILVSANSTVLGFKHRNQRRSRISVVLASLEGELRKQLSNWAVSCLSDDRATSLRPRRTVFTGCPGSRIVIEKMQ